MESDMKQIREFAEPWMRAATPHTLRTNRVSELPASNTSEC